MHLWRELTPNRTVINTYLTLIIVGGLFKDIETMQLALQMHLSYRDAALENLKIVWGR